MSNEQNAQTVTALSSLVSEMEERIDIMETVVENPDWRGELKTLVRFLRMLVEDRESGNDR